MTTTSIFRHKHRNTKNNPFWIIPLGIFTVVSLLPHNALAFEYTLPTSTANKLVAQANIYRESNNLDWLIPAISNNSRTNAVVAVASPVTVTAPETVVAVATVAPQLPIAASVKKVKPTLDSPVVLEGEASYYSRAGCLGCHPQMIMANGQPLDDNALTMAIGADKKHLVGYKATVTSLATGKSVVVRITDTGGFYQAKYGHRVADLTVATKQAIGMKGGVGQVRVEITN